MADVYGTQFADAAVDRINSLLTLLITEMASDDPRPLAVYTRHNVANLTVPSFSIAVDAVTPNWEGAQNNDTVTWDVIISVRVHVGYQDDVVDSRTVSRLMESATNKLMINLRESGSAMWIRQISELVNYETFSESDSVGGSVRLLMNSYVTYTQE